MKEEEFLKEWIRYLKTTNEMSRGSEKEIKPDRKPNKLTERYKEAIKRIEEVLEEIGEYILYNPMLVLNYLEEIAERGETLLEDLKEYGEE